MFSIKYYFFFLPSLPKQREQTQQNLLAFSISIHPLTYFSEQLLHYSFLLFSREEGKHTFRTSAFPPLALRRTTVSTENASRQLKPGQPSITQLASQPAGRISSSVSASAAATVVFSAGISRSKPTSHRKISCTKMDIRTCRLFNEINVFSKSRCIESFLVQR